MSTVAIGAPRLIDNPGAAHSGLYFGRNSGRDANQWQPDVGKHSLEHV